MDQMLTALRKYTGTLGMETTPLKASFSISEINKFGAGTQFSYLCWDVPIPKCMRENTVNFGHFNIISKLAGSNSIN